MVACLAFGVVDFLAEPSLLTATFALSQLPFAAGAVLLARATYPENLNDATLWGTTGPETVMDELMLRGLVVDGQGG